MWEFYEAAAAPTEFNYLEREVEVCAFTAAGPGFRPSSWAWGVGYKGSLAGLPLLAPGTLREV